MKIIWISVLNHFKKKKKIMFNVLLEYCAHVWAIITEMTHF